MNMVRSVCVKIVLAKYKIKYLNGNQGRLN